MSYKGFKLTNDEAASLLNRRVDIKGQMPARRPFERMWLRNIAYFFGKQYFIQDQGTGRLQEPWADGQPHRVRYKANLILGDVLRAMLTVMNADGEFVVPPTKNTRTAQKGAWVATKLFEHLTDECGFKAKQEWATLWAAICGSVIYKPVWDPEKGSPQFFYWPDGNKDHVVASPTDEEINRAEQKGFYDVLFDGDVDVHVVPMFQAFHDWRAREGGVPDARWMAQNQVMDLEQLEEVYGYEAVKNVIPDDGLEGSLYYNEMISFISSAYSQISQTYAYVDEKRGDQTVVSEMWERPGPRNNFLGRKIVYAGGWVLENRDNPYRSTGFALPFVKQDWITAPGRFFGLSLVEHLTGPQFQYNRSASTMIEHQNIFGHPATFVPKASGIPTGHFSIQPGVVYPYNPYAGKIEYSKPPSLSPEVAKNASDRRNEMALISSTQSIENSKLPGQIRSAPGLSLMLEERNKGLMHPAKNFLEAKREVGEHQLRLAKKFYSGERVLQYVGEDKQYRVLHFMASNIETDLRLIVDQSKMLSSPAAARAEIMEAVQIGAVDIQNPQDREEVLRALNFNSAQPLIAARLQEEENQEREIEEMMVDPMEWVNKRMDAFAPAGSPRVSGFPTNDWDDHEVHARVLLDFMRSEEFRKVDLIAQSLILEHFRAHTKIIEQAQMQQLAMMQAMQGGGAQKGEASQPKPQTVG